jgi:hypothetical protein
MRQRYNVPLSVELLGMSSSGKWRHVGLVRTDVSEERIASIFRIKIIGELGTLAVTRVIPMLALGR